MEIIVKPILLIRHTDLDGFAAGAVVANSPMVKSIIGDTDPICNIDLKDYITDLAYCYNGSTYMETCIEKHLEAKSKIFIVDISISNSNSDHFRRIIDYAINATEDTEGSEIVWIDHHQSSIDWISNTASNEGYNFNFSPKVSATVDIRRSGAYLAYQTLFNCLDDDMLDVIKYTDDHDRFIHNFPESIQLNDATFLNKYAYLKNPLSAEWSKLIIEEHSDLLNEILIAGKNYHEFYMEEASGYYNRNGFKFILKLSVYDNPCDFNTIKRCWDCYNGIDAQPESRYILVSALNRVGNSLMFGNDYELSDACTTFVQRPDFRYSAYSSKSYVNCGKFMSLLGGGGHRGAAGCPSTNFNLPAGLLTFFPFLPIPEEFGGGDVKYIMRMRVTKRAAAELLGDTETLCEKFIRNAVDTSEFKESSISDGNMEFDDYDIANTTLIEYIFDFEDGEFKMIDFVTD